jgi:hypothetical protein
MTDEFELWTYSEGNAPSTPRLFRSLLEETEVGQKKFRFASSAHHSEIYEKRAQILLTYQREAVKKKPRQKYLPSKSWKFCKYCYIYNKILNLTE